MEPIIIWELREATPEEKEKANQRELERKRYEALMREQVEPLLCGACGHQIGWVYANDLEGSRFYCGCIKEDK